MAPRRRRDECNTHDVATESDVTTHTPGLAEETIGSDEASVAAEFISFLTTVSARHHPSGVMPRFNQGRAAGCVDAEFTVLHDLPPELRVGLFA